MTRTIEIELPRLAQLLKAELKLEALECAGVDNWEGYSESLRESGDTYGSYWDEAAKIDAALADGTLTP